jgi:hypothetical protein
MPYAEQMEFASLAFPKDRQVLYLGEMALKLRVTDQHVGDLIEEGEIQAINIAGADADWFRAPVSFLKLVSERSGLSEEVLARLLAQSRTRGSNLNGRKFWRIPVEAYTAFLQRRHSFQTALSNLNRKD